MEGFDSKMLMIFLCYNYKSVQYYELLLENQMINSKYHSELDHFKIAINKEYQIKRKGIIFYQDNTKSHISLVTNKNL